MQAPKKMAKRTKVQNPSCDLDSSHQLEAVCGQLLLWKWLFASKMDRAPLSASKTNLRVAASTSPHESNTKCQSRVPEP